MPYIHPLIDFTVEVFVVFQNTVLLRVHDKCHMWLSVGGHIELHEDPVEAAIREVKEEVGLDIRLDDRLQRIHIHEDEYRELIPPYFVNRHRINPHHEDVTFTYFATTSSHTITQPSTHERSPECRWFTTEEVKKLHGIRENVRQYALCALHTLGK